jgi:hypothetical protein
MGERAMTAALDRSDDGPAGDRGAGSRRRRTIVLTTHIATSVGALGADLVLLTLGVAGVMSGEPAVVRAAYLAMDLIAGAVVVPLALTAVATGVVVGLNTRWGITRHWWVLTKLVLTIGLATAAVFVLRPALNRAATDAVTVPLDQLVTVGIGDAARAAIIAPTVALLVLVTTTVLAVAKPWGSTRWARRSRAPSGHVDGR